MAVSLFAFRLTKYNGVSRSPLLLYCMCNKKKPQKPLLLRLLAFLFVFSISIFGELFGLFIYCVGYNRICEEDNSHRRKYSRYDENNL